MVDSTPTPTPAPIQLPSEMPSLKEMAFNLVGSGIDIVAQAVAGGQVLASEEVAKARWDICFNCEFLIKQSSGDGATIAYMYRCNKCGCGMRVKVRFAAMKCPINKWGSVL